MQILPPEPAPIVVTASRAPIAQSETAASVSIIGDQLIVRLDPPAIGSLLRLTPSAAVSSSGPAGSLTDIRIRGAEANHSLLFVEGIRINDPASGDIPRFELLNADIASRIEVVRGPQSALWGSDAIGGVIAVNGTADAPGFAASAEAGSFGSRRASVGGATEWTGGELSGALAFQRADGIDSFGSPGGDRDGYRNLAGRVRGALRPSPSLEIGVAAVGLAGSSEFDGYNLTTFVHEDTLDSSRNRLGAGRIWVAAGHDNSPWRGKLAASYLASSNRNLLDGDPLNRTWGSRKTAEAQVEHSFGRRRGRASHNLGRRGGRRGFPRPRHALFWRYRPGPQPRASGDHRRMARGRQSREYRHRRPARSVQPFQGCNHAPRRGARPAWPRVRAGRFLRPGYRAADLLRSLRFLPRKFRG